MKRSLALLMTFGFLCYGGLAKADSLVTNGGFETGDFAGWTTVAAPGGGGNFGVNGSNPHSGTYAADFGASLLDFDLIQQNLNTAQGQQYVLSFWLNIASSGDPSNDFQALWNGTVVTDVTSETESWGNYTQYSTLVTAREVTHWSSEATMPHHSISSMMLLSLLRRNQPRSCSPVWHCLLSLATGGFAGAN